MATSLDPWPAPATMPIHPAHPDGTRCPHRLTALGRPRDAGCPGRDHYRAACSHCPHVLTGTVRHTLAQAARDHRHTHRTEHTISVPPTAAARTIAGILHRTRTAAAAQQLLDDYRAEVLAPVTEREDRIRELLTGVDFQHVAWDLAVEVLRILDGASTPALPDAPSTRTLRPGLVTGLLAAATAQTPTDQPKETSTHE